MFLNKNEKIALLTAQLLARTTNQSIETIQRKAANVSDGIRVDGRSISAWQRSRKATLNESKFVRSKIREARAS